MAARNYCKVQQRGFLITSETATSSGGAWNGDTRGRELDGVTLSSVSWCNEKRVPLKRRHWPHRYQFSKFHRTF